VTPRVASIGALLGLALAGFAWSALPPPVPVAPPPAPEAAPSRAVEDAATATLALALIAAGAGKTPGPGLDPFGLEVARIARSFLLHRPVGFRDDCSGFASAVYSQAGVPMDLDVWGLWDQAGVNGALHWGVPQVGDIVFFDGTTDRNGDGQFNDDLTHVGVVIDVEPDGTVMFAHAGTSAGRTIGVMRLDEPSSDRDARGRKINTWLREPRASDPPTASYLAGDLWAGFAHVEPGSDWL